MTLQKKKKTFFSVVSERLSFFTPSPRPSPYSFIPRDDSETRSQPFSVPAETAVHIRERGGGGEGVGEAETVRETEGRGEDARGRLWHKRHFIAQTRFQRINTNIPVTLCWYCRRMYGVAQSHSSSGVQVSVGAELTKPWPLHSCRHLQSELNPSYDVK